MDGARVWASVGLLRSGTSRTYYGVSVDTRVALGGDGGGRYDTLGGGETVSRPDVVDDLRTGAGDGTPLTVI